MRYRRAKDTGATYFFTVALAERKGTLLLLFSFKPRSPE